MLHPRSSSRQASRRRADRVAHPVGPVRRHISASHRGDPGRFVAWTRRSASTVELAAGSVGSAASRPRSRCGHRSAMRAAVDSRQPTTPAHAARSSTRCHSRSTPSRNGGRVVTTLAEAWRVCAVLDRIDAERAPNDFAMASLLSAPTRPTQPGSARFDLCREPMGRFVFSTRDGHQVRDYEFAGTNRCRRKAGHDGKHRWWTNGVAPVEVLEW